MNNNEKTTLGVFETYQDAESVIKDLREAGVPDDKISYIQHTSVRSVPVEVPEGVGAGATLGAFAGLTLTFFALPAFPLIVAGPVATLLGLAGGAAVGALAGGLVEALINLGFSESEARIIQTKIEAGSTVVMVQDPLAYDELMRKNGAEEAYVV